jgi:D-alanine-D-alanine ligase
VELTPGQEAGEGKTEAGMSSRTSARIAVLMGGRSAEREVSLVSGRECAAALRSKGFDVVEIDAGADLVQRLAELRPDVAFNALHGRWGEDGCVQGILEWLAIPYTHSGVLASALAMDKTRSKQVFAAAGLPVARSILVDRKAAATAHPMAPPYVVKPNNEGSSVGVYLIGVGANGPARLSDDMPEQVMVEEYLPGRELTTTVLGDRALSVTDILAEGWYDYHAKYAPGGSRHVVPADIPDEISAACLDFALRAHNALGCRGVSRTDFRWDESRGASGLYLLEVNTQPGMTPTSLAPEQAAHAGMSFGDLVRWMVEDASCCR